MLKNKRTGFTIKKPEEVLAMSESALELLKTLGNELIFIIPFEIENNQSKMAYKVGFLKMYYKNLYPDKSYADIYKIINIQWQIFKSNRQMERYASKYIELFHKKGES
jgi:hypothetical protein